MGILDILSRKVSRDSKPKPELTSQPYDAFTAAKPPVRGVHPPVGNGPNVLRGLQHLAQNNQQTLPFVHEQAQHQGRLRSHSEARPRTDDDAVSSRSCPQPPAPHARRPVKVRPRLLSQHSAESAFATRTDIEAHGPSAIPPVPAIPGAHSRQGSVASGRSRAYVDLLDAQGELRPSSFRSRLQASGARDYGEDVAERNLAQDGICLPNIATRRSKAPDDNSTGVNTSRSMTGRSSNDYHGSLKSPKSTTRHHHESGLHPNYSYPIGEDEDALPPSIPRYRAENMGSRGRPSTASPRLRDSVLVAKMRQDEDYYSSNRPIYSSAGGMQPTDDQWQARAPEALFVDTDSGYGQTSVSDRDIPEEALVSKANELNYWSKPGQVHHDVQKRPTSQHSWSGSREVSTSGMPSTPLTRPRTSSTHCFHGYHRSTGGGSMHSQPRLDNIFEHIPARKSSLAQSGTSVTTPTTVSSIYSRNPFPASNHTANTSVDSTRSVQLTNSGHVRSKSFFGRFLSSGHQAIAQNDHPNSKMLEGSLMRRDSVPEGRKYADGDVEYISSSDGSEDLTTDGSDIDSFVQKTLRRRHRRRGEEDLQFRDGQYGDALPGLFDSKIERRTPSWPSNSALPSHDHLGPGQSLRLNEFTRDLNPDNSSQLPRPAVDFSSLELSDSDENSLSADFDLSRAQALMTLATLGGADMPRRLSLLRAMLEDSAEPSKADGRSALRRRKEAKAKQRTARYEGRMSVHLAKTEMEKSAMTPAEGS